jgi:hypothetical protein
VIAKKIALLAGAVFVSAALLEGGSHLLYYFAHGQAFSSDEQWRRLASPLEDTGAGGPVAERAELPETVRNKVLHPFLGYVYDHTRNPRDTNRFGFGGPEPLVERSPDTVNLVILGGSVAMQLYRTGSQRLVEELKRAPRYRHKSFRVLSLSLGGYKQPQQLMALAYMLSLGAEYDIAVNLDGFNELVLPTLNNIPVGVYASFPRNWHLYARLGLDVPQSLNLARIELLSARRERWRSLLRGTPFSRSAFLLSAVGAADRYFEGETAREDALLRERLAASEPDFQISGPFEPYQDGVRIFDDLVALWKNSSLQMAYLARSNGVRYLHFLQPNQYVRGSKQLTPKERRIAIRKGPAPHKIVVREAYGALSREGADLRARGVEFHDLTGLFREEKRTIYEDDCCHVNPLGNRLMADAIASAILAGGPP